jgi:hypothetical protein
LERELPTIYLGSALKGRSFVSATTTSHSSATSRAPALAFTAPSISALAKSLCDQFATANAAPSHLQMLNWLARGAGHRNYQAFRAAAVAAPTPAKRSATPQSPAALSAHATKALMQFDEAGRLVRWPSKFAVQRFAMWALWMRFDASRVYTEREVNTLLNAWATFGDPVTLRRELINMKLLARKSDCSAYWKEPARPDDEVRTMLHELRARFAA